MSKFSNTVSTYPPNVIASPSIPVVMTVLSLASCASFSICLSTSSKPAVSSNSLWSSKVVNSFCFMPTAFLYCLAM